MTSLERYKAAIVGCGRIAGNLESDPLRNHPCTHIGAYNHSPQIEVVACASRTEEQAAEFARKWAIPKYYGNYRTMLEHESPDIVSICTPAEHHHEAVLCAVENGVKAVFCEKAIGLSLNEADEMIEKCRSNGVHLTINHTRRWCWDFNAVKEIIDSNELGELHSITGYMSGSLIHTGTHFFDLLGYFCGDTDVITGCVTGDTVAIDGHDLCDSDGYAIIKMKNGVYAIVNCVSKKYYSFEMDLLFDNGRIRIGNGIHELWRAAKSRHYAEYSELHHSDFPRPPNIERNPLIIAVCEIIESIENGKDTSSTGEDGRKALATAIAVFISYAQGGNPISITDIDLETKIISR